MQTHMKGASQVFSPEITHVFTLTLSGKLVWQMLRPPMAQHTLCACKSEKTFVNNLVEGDTGLSTPTSVKKSINFRVNLLISSLKFL